ncbi:MAG: hypothetical protein V4663_03480 [Bacteroidota bacterium]
MKKVNLLSRAEMRKVMGGNPPIGGGEGGRCVAYCCPTEGSCSSATGTSTSFSCTSNEDCQSAIISGGGTCSSGFYVAALCK